MPVLDLNNPEFQRQLVALDKHERHAVISAIGKLLTLDWHALHRHSGFNWEEIKEREVRGPNGETLNSLRVTQKMRLVGYRNGHTLVLLSLHPDHDSAYGR
ncbi:hypothetical protein ACFOPQ_13480 [Deinococcus antarcticus]|uniref:Uncharacterized protein n=1 Tax=Deinococcus antarcticus TaxID=1298767 RepID=A0ABV8ABF4_9DEIO